MNAKRAWPVLLVVLPGGSILAGAVWWWRRRKAAAVKDLADQLRQAFSPKSKGQADGSAYADDFALAAYATAPSSLTPFKWGVFLGAIVSRESQFGLLLTPRGPNGTGDFGHGRGLGQVDDRDRSDRLQAQLDALTDDNRDQFAPAIERELARTQLRLEHIESGEWTDPTKHLLFVAKYARDYFDSVEDLAAGDVDEQLRIAAAAYNAGELAVRQKAAAGADVDVATTGKDYGADVERRADDFTSRAA